MRNKWMALCSYFGGLMLAVGTMMTPAFAATMNPMTGDARGVIMKILIPVLLIALVVIIVMAVTSSKKGKGKGKKR